MARSLLRYVFSLVAAVCAAAGPARAAEGLDLRFSGYGTVAATYADTHRALYRSSWRQGSGSRGRIDPGVDSRLGGQVNADFGGGWSAVAQVLAVRRDGGDRLDMEWLYAQAQLNDELSVRVGRLVLPAFMLSDVRNVGYAQHWVRTPAEVYFWLPVTSVDGAQLLYRRAWNGTTFTVQPTVGQADTRQYFDFGGGHGLFSGKASFRNVRGLNLSAERGPWTLRFGQTVVDVHQNWDNAPPFLAPLDFRHTFTGLGLQYDDGALLVMTELVNTDTSDGSFDSRSGYLSVGHRFGPWMPYVTRAHLHNAGTRIASIPPSITSAAGLRWDAWKDVAVKGQVERTRLSGQQFIALDPGVDRRGSVTVFTLALEFVF